MKTQRRQMNARSLLNNTFQNNSILNCTTYSYQHMANKRKLNLGPTQANKFIAELLEKREKIISSVQFRHDFWESQQQINYQNEFDRLQGANKITGLQPNVKSRMKQLQLRREEVTDRDT